MRVPTYFKVEDAAHPGGIKITYVVRPEGTNQSNAFGELSASNHACLKAQGERGYVFLNQDAMMRWLQR